MEVLLPAGLALLAVVACGFMWGSGPSQVRVEPTRPSAVVTSVGSSDDSPQGPSSAGFVAEPAMPVTAVAVVGLGFLPEAPVENSLAFSDATNAVEVQAQSGDSDQEARSDSAVAPMPLLPLALLDQSVVVRPNALQQVALNSLAQDFTAQVIGDAVDQPQPHTAEVIQRWQEAQPTSDQFYRLWFGWSAAMQQQLQLVRVTSEALVQ